MKYLRIIALSICVLSCIAGYAVNPNDSIPVDTVLLDDGSLYMGQIQDSLFNGHGMCIYADGAVYEGSWKDGLWDGQGAVIYPDGDIYKGSFKKHVKEGKGTYIYGTGARYDGEWKNDRFNGNGKLFFEDGGLYDGAWKDDMKHGYGKLTSSNGRSITGFFYYDEYLGMPFDTEIVRDTIMTDELKEWGFQQEPPRGESGLSVGMTYGFKGMVTVTFWADVTDHFFYGISGGFNIDPPTKGPTIGGLGFMTFSDDIHFAGEYISSQYLFDAGYIFKNLSIGGSLGIGFITSYLNCKANGSTDSYKSYSIQYGQAYSRKGNNGHTLDWRGYLKYPILLNKQPKAQMYLGYGNADGLFLGIGTYL